MLNRSQDLWDLCLQAQFDFRKKFLGRLRLRATLPDLGENPWHGPELNYYTEIIATCFSKEAAARILSVVDVGFRNGSYLKALADSFPNAEITGVEVDGYRRYFNLYTRRDYALAYAENLRRFQNKKINLIFEDFAQVTNSKKESILPNLPEQTLFCFFFPFVSVRPCQRWGLPKKYVHFKELLNNCQRLTQGQEMTRSSKWPRILSVHQGEWEGELARQNYEDLGLPFKCWIFDVEKVSELQRVPAYENWIFLTEGA